MRATDRVLVVLFLSIITLPLAANLVGQDGADPGAENRELAAFPELNRSWTSIADYGSGLSAWFEDHFGFRSALIRWNGETRLFLMGVSPSAAVVKGRGDWFFYGEDHALEDYANDPPMPPEAVDNWREALVRARDWLAARKVAYVFTIAPDKHTIYAGEMPRTIARIAPVSRTDQLLLAALDGDVAAVDLRPSLFAARVSERIYQKTDTHWNDRGAFVAYQRIIEAVRALQPRVGPAWTRADFDAEGREVAGMDLAGMMGLTRVLREIDLPLVPRRVRCARVIEPAGAEPTAEEGRLVTEIPGSTLPRALIIRDSFTSQLVPFLSEHFSHAVYLWQNDFLPEDVQREKPDVVVQEIVGRHLYDFIPSPRLVPR
jgi:alginate O-acetyltransferase complex protein AlgJ